MTRSILLVKTSSLGDVIHNLPAVSDLRAAIPDARIDWAVEEAYEPIVRLHPAIDRVIPVAIRRWRGRVLMPATWREIAALRHTLGERAYDAIVDTQGLLKSALVARLARGRRFGFDRASAREPLAARFYDEPIPVGREAHATERCRALVAAALDYRMNGPLDYGVAADSSAVVGTEVLLLHGTARPEKEWPEAAWIELGRRIAASDGSVLLLRGTAAEAARSERIAAAVPGARVADRLGLRELADVVRCARAVIGVDTGLLHLAAALRVPLVGIFGATDPRLTGPVGTGPIAIRRAARPDIPVSVDDVLAAFTTVKSASRA